MGRRASRDIAMKLLYQFEIQKDGLDEQIQTAFEETDMAEKDKQFVKDILEGVEEHKDQIDRTIEKFSRGWKINRLSKVDLSILRLSVYEITYRNDIPFTVSVNEAVELAKKYSTEDAGAFINGILGNISRPAMSSGEMLHN